MDAVVRARSWFRARAVTGLDWHRGFWNRAAIYLPFVFALVVALWPVSASLNVQTTDPIFHAFLSRIYADDGLWFRRFTDPGVLAYPSGFGVINSITTALAPLSVVQAVNLQHVCMTVISLFLITGLLAAAVERPVWFLHCLPLVFLCLCPLYALFPDCLYESTARQAAPPLLAALLVLSLLPTGPPLQAFYGRLVVQAALVLLVTALNPACVPFMALAAFTVLFLNCRKGYISFGQGPLRMMAVHISVMAFLGAMVLGGDPYYRNLVRGAAPSFAPADAGAPLFFSWKDALHSALTINPLQLSPASSFTPPTPRTEDFKGWPDRLPQAALPLLAMTAALFALGYQLTGRQGERSRSCQFLSQFVLAGSGLWLATKYGMGFLEGGLSPNRGDSRLLGTYVGFLTTRCELLLLFFILAGAGTTWILVTEGAWWRKSIPVTVLAPLVCLPYTMMGYQMNPGRNGFIRAATYPFGNPVTPQDVELIAWIDAHISPEEGVIGLAALAFRSGPNKADKQIHPFGPAQALLLYGKHYNFCFAPQDCWEHSSFDDYTQHVQDVLDVEWCWHHNIRYFYLPTSHLDSIPGLEHAVADRVLEPVRDVGSSCLYQMQPPVDTSVVP
jgi:hypothetical protein